TKRTRVATGQSQKAPKRIRRSMGCCKNKNSIQKPATTPDKLCTAEGRGSCRAGSAGASPASPSQTRQSRIVGVLEYTGCFGHAYLESCQICCPISIQPSFLYSDEQRR